MPVAIVIAGAIIGASVYLGARTIAGGGLPASNGQANPQAGEPLAPSGDIVVGKVTSKDHLRGNPDAKVVIVEYSDLECPFCKMFHQTMNQAFSKYGSEIAWVYRHFPLDQLHRKARKEAEATECVAELGGNQKFWAYVDKIFEVTTSNDGLPESELPKLAEQVGVNRAAFESCLASGRHAKVVQDHADDALAAGARGTPYSVIVTKDGNTPINGALPYEQVDSMIREALGKK